MNIPHITHQIIRLYPRQSAYIGSIIIAIITELIQLKHGGDLPLKKQQQIKALLLLRFIFPKMNLYLFIKKSMMNQISILLFLRIFPSALKLAHLKKDILFALNR